MTELAHIIAQSLKDERIRQEMSQEHLAELANTHRVYISEIERCVKVPTITTLHKLCLALNIKLADLFKDF